MCTTLTHSRPWQSTSFELKLLSEMSWSNIKLLPKEICLRTRIDQHIKSTKTSPRKNVPTLQHLFLLAEIELVDQFILTECDKCVFFIILKSKRSENKWWFVTFCLLFISGKLMTRYNTYFFNLWGQWLWFWLSSAYCAERRFAEVGRVDTD